MTDANELPEGTVILTSAQPTGAVDVELAVDLARRGASPLVVRAVGGDEAVRQAEAVVNDARGRQP
jgi:hypothetical protein